MFKMPTYDHAGIAVVGFGIPRVLALHLSSEMRRPKQEEDGPMVFGVNFRRQARVCVQLSEDCSDRHLAERFKIMAANLVAKADDVEELPSERVRRQEQSYFVLS
jgi:hypothetical protein